MTYTFNSKWYLFNYNKRFFRIKLVPTVYENLQKEKVKINDVIYIETSTGAVKRVGRCDAYATEFDLEAEEYVPIPKGEPHKKK